MKFQAPNQVNIKNLVVQGLLVLVVGYAAYYLSGKVWVGAYLSILSMILALIINRWSINVAFIKHLRRFGSDFTKEYSQETYRSSIMGFIPFNGQNVPCSVFVDESGIIISKWRRRRYIPWSVVVGHKELVYLGQKILEMNIKNYEQPNRLVIPWAQGFAKFIPEKGSAENS